MTGISEVDVVIVGGGPVGLALAVDLGLRRVSCALIEKTEGGSRIPKGQSLTHRSLEHFYFWGIASDLRRARVLPVDYPNGGMEFYGNLLSPYRHAPVLKESVRPFYFQDSERLPQYATERVLRNKLGAMSRVQKFFGWTAEEISQRDDGVAITISKPGLGRQQIEGLYGIGCDGVGSLVRKQCGIASSGVDFQQPMILAVFRSRDLSARLEQFPVRSTYNVLRPELNGFWQFFGRVDAEDRWFFHSPIPKSVNRESCDFRDLIQEAAGFELECEFEHRGFWDLRTSIAETFRSGRLFIAGDAAHSHPPYGGFGLNSGLEDVVNLGWKLAAKIQGWGDDGLLDSYCEERQPIMAQTVGKFIAAPIACDREFLTRYHPVVNRAEFEEAWSDRGAALDLRMRHYEPNYEGSSVVAGPPLGTPGAYGRHLALARPGHHLTPVVLSSGKNVFEALGAEFSLLAFGCDSGAVRRFEHACSSLSVPLTTISDSPEQGREALGSRLILVRPDQYIAWCGDLPPLDIHAQIARSVGRKPI